MHYHTEHIISRVNAQPNTDATLTRGVGRFFTEDDPVPGEIESYAPNLDELFEKGAELVLETLTDWADEGGECYMAYIIAPEHEEQYQRAYDEVAFEASGLLFPHRWILEHPDHFWLVWAGPY